MDRESLEALLTQGLSLDEIGRRFRKHPSTVGYWLKKYGLRAAHREKHAAKGGLERKVLIRLVDAGRTQREMAADLGVSQGTIRYWLTRYGVRGATSGNRARRSQARDGGFLVIQDDCPRHGRTDFFLEGRGNYRCKRCRQERVIARRRRVKQILVAEAGGRCSLCGYDRHIGALHFHHVDPREKRFNLGQRGITRSLERCRQEAAKCILLCANCHAEVEAGLASIPR